MEYGGYFSIYENKGQHFYENALKLNTARNCLEYIIKVKQYKKIYLPYYICDVIIEPLKKLKINYEFYNIDKNLEILFEKNIKNDEGFLYVNYFGIKNDYIKKKSDSIKNMIIDNTQGFFSKPLKDIPTIYSCRKFFPVVDGAYLFINKKLDDNFKENKVADNIKFLYKKYELDSNSAYDLYLENEKSLSNQEIKKMSKITSNMMKSFDYENIRLKRERNFLYMHSKLSEINKLKIEIKNILGPMVYPLLVNKRIHEKLIEKKVYVATYWKEVLNRTEGNSIENNLVKNLIPIPIDHRYELEQMEEIANIVKREVYND